MAKKKDSPGNDSVPSTDELAEVERDLTDWGEAIRSGAKFKLISLPIDVPETVDSDALISRPNGLEVVELFNTLISNEEALEPFLEGMEKASARTRGERDEQWEQQFASRDMTYVEAHLIHLATRYLSVKAFLETEYDISVPSKSYDALRTRLWEHYGDYLKVRVLELGQPEQYSPVYVPDISNAPNFADLPQLAATAVLEGTKTIAKIIDISVREFVAPLTLDSAIQFARVHSFVEMSYSLLNIKDAKERGWRELQANYRRKGARRLRQAIRKKLLDRTEAENSHRYRYTEGKKRGQLKVEYLAGLITQDFERDANWKRKPPGKNTIREEIRKLETTG